MGPIVVNYLFEVKDSSRFDLVKEILREYEGFAYSTGYFLSIQTTYSYDHRIFVLSQSVESIVKWNSFCQLNKNAIDKIFTNNLISKEFIQFVHSFITF
ncbi:MAG: hypothetical protein JNL65_11825 [Saprospiraceae bacterium]|nr:hypothetical protein [Saprospiraceae bacterium]